MSGSSEAAPTIPLLSYWLLFDPVEGPSRVFIRFISCYFLLVSSSCSPLILPARNSPGLVGKTTDSATTEALGENPVSKMYHIKHHCIVAMKQSALVSHEAILL